MAQRVHRSQFDPCEVGVSDLMPEQAWPAAVQFEGSRSRTVSRIVELANLEPYPQAVPVGLAASYAAHGPPGRGVDPIDFVRTVAIVRVTMPQTLIGVSLGPLAVEAQALCFMAGANTIFLEDEGSPRFRVPAIHPIESLSRLGLRVRGPSGLHH
jgi:biotin synthase